MTKQQRAELFNKYGGKCAYCGCVLEKGWHVDEVLPVRRKYEYGKESGFMFPDRLHVDNQNPSCASYNINKHNLNIEQFREMIAGFIKHLNQRSTQYKISKRYGLVEETQKQVLFYFETYVP